MLLYRSVATFGGTHLFTSMITGGREILQEKNSPRKPVKPKDEKSLNVYVRLRHPSIHIPTCQHSMGTI